MAGRIRTSIRDLSKTFVQGPREVPAVSHVSLDIRDKEFVALVGPSGCGKSTILNMVGALVAPSGGEIVVDDERVAGALSIWQMALSTVQSTVWGFLVGISTGFVAGLVLGRNGRMARVFEPYIIAFNSLPRIALVPLITMIFGFGLLAKDRARVDHRLLHRVLQYVPGCAERGCRLDLDGPLSRCGRGTDHADGHHPVDPRLDVRLTRMTGWQAPKVDWGGAVKDTAGGEVGPSLLQQTDRPNSAPLPRGSLSIHKEEWGMKTSLARWWPRSCGHSRSPASLTIVVSISVLAGSVFAATVPPGFTDALVASGLTWPTALAVANDGRVFVTEQSGTLRVIKNGALLPTPFMTMTVKGQGGSNEEGLVGITLDPSFATNNFLYVYYTVPSSGNVASHNRVSRFTANGDVAVPGSERDPLWRCPARRPELTTAEAFTSAPTASCTSQWEITVTAATVNR